MKTRTFLIAIAFFSACIFSSCKKEATVPKPVINLEEVGIDDSHIAYAGATLHIEAEIVAEGNMSIVSVEIYQEESSSDKITAEYDEFSGMKNTTFHKHVEIPAGTTPGTYQFHLTVTDLEGNQTTVEDEITIEKLDDEVAPLLNISSAPENGKIFATDETISINGLVSDNIALGGILVALVRTDDNISDAEVTDENSSVIVLLHNHTFEDPDEYQFSASIIVGAEKDNNMTPALIQGDNAWKSGDYYILVKVADANGNWTYSSHYPIKINL